MKPGVRVTGGTFRGRGLAVPAGARPTEGRVREALFSIWADRVEQCRFLDLFAGSGVVGVEAASRGALQVLCIDQDLQAVRTIAANAARLGEALLSTRRLTLPAGLARLAADGTDGAAGPAVAGGVAGARCFDLAFADPPYRYDAYEALLVGLRPLLAAGAEVAVEHSSRRTLPPAAGPLVRTGSRRYGESSLSFYRASE
jgi:16S rRNA (guanine966-N2)-methyltransferase